MTPDVTIEDVVALTQALVRIDSSNTDSGGPGESQLAAFVQAWLAHRSIETHRIEPIAGRPSIVGVVRGKGGGKSLMLNGHMDTVTLAGYDGDALSADIEDGKMYGRGTADMKSGLAAQMVALANAAKLPNLKGDVILAAVADEEASSIGTTALLEAGWRADAAIVAEPTEMALVTAHKGIATFEVDVFGKAAHGSRPDLGVDAICKAGYLLVELDRFGRELAKRDGKEAGPPNVHCGVIRGGEETNSYPAKCTVSIERRTVAGETAESTEGELRVILERLTRCIKDFRCEMRCTLYQAPYFIEKEHEFVRLVKGHAEKVTGHEAVVKGETYWTDMALLGEKGIPGVIWGPRGFGLHAKKEWVEVESVRQMVTALGGIIEEFCNQDVPVVGMLAGLHGLHTKLY